MQTQFLLLALFSMRGTRCGKRVMDEACTQPRTTSRRRTTTEGKEAGGKPGARPHDDGKLASLRHGSAIEKHGLVGSSFSFLLFLGELVSLLTGYAVKGATA